MHKTGENIGGTFGVGDPTTSGLIAPDALPTAELRINGVSSAAVVTVAATGTTGQYIWSVTLPTIADGTVLEIWVFATVATIAGGGIIWQGEGCTKRHADLSAEIAALAGVGPFAVTIAVDDGAAWVPNAEVKVYDAGVPCGAGTTDAYGRVFLNLAAGSYQVVIYHPGYTSTPQQLQLPDDGNPTYSVSAIVRTGSTDPAWADIHADVYDEDGELEPGVVCSLRIYKEPTGSGMIYDGVIAEATSDAQGEIVWPKRPVGAQLEYWRGPADQESRRVKRVTIAAADVVNGVYWLPSIVGHVTTDN